MSKTVSAIYENHSKAKHAINLLKQNGVTDSEVSVLASEGSLDKNIKIEENSKAPEGISIGAGLGATAGAAIGGPTAVGAVTLTGGVGLVAAGPIVAAFAGAGAGAGVGGLAGGLVGLGIPETEAKLIDEKLGEGQVFLGVTVDSERESSIKDVLNQANPKKITVH